MLEHPSIHYYVGRRVQLDGEEWMITACNFICDIASLRRVADLQNPEVGYHGTLKELAFSKVPLGSVET